MKHYSIWSNYIFTFKPLWQQKRSIALCFLAAAVLFVAVPVVGMMITSMMIGSLEQGISMQHFVYGVANRSDGVEFYFSIPIVK